MDVDLELDDDLVLEDAVPKSPRASKATRPTKPAPTKRRAPRTPAPTPSFDSDSVRSMLADEPWLLEKGLNLYADDDGEPLGVDFPTPVGGIDILARNAKDHFVVVLIPASDAMAESVSSMLQCMGWVRKHLADPGNEVRGVIVAEHVPEELTYAVAGAGGTITFKGFRLALTFHDLEV